MMIKVLLEAILASSEKKSRRVVGGNSGFG
jgi:hypothetical protein